MEICMTIDGRCVREKASRKPAFVANYDVVVAGLGTAGAEALKQCVQSGLKTMGVERLNGMGGLSTLGIVCFGGGLTRRLCEYEQVASAADVSYCSVITGVWMDGRRIVGVRVVSNGIVRDVGTRAVIDATGNASIAKMCGCRLRKGRAFDGVVAPCARGETWLEDGKTVPRPIYRNYPDDLTDSVKAVSATISKLAKERHAFWQKQRKFGRMLRPSAMVGAREELRVETEATATMADAISGKRFPDPLFFACEPEDLPVYYGDHAFESEAIRDWKVHCGLPMFRYPSSVPYGTIVAKGVENLFVPSKHFGVAHDLGGSLRMQPEMRKLGIASALAASLAISRGCRAKDVPYSELKPLLEKSGCLKPARSDRVNAYHGKQFDRFSDDDVVSALSQDITRTNEWWQGEKGKATGSDAERAAFALWTAWERAATGGADGRSALADRLFAELGRTSSRYAGNFAIALALMGDRRALPTLREIVANPGGKLDPVIDRAYPNRIKALDMLGRFSDEKSVPLIVAVIQDGARAFTDGLAAAHAFDGGDVVCRFQALSYALMAMQSILRKRPNRTLATRMEKLRDALPPLRHPDGYDLCERLRKVSFASSEVHANGRKS